MAVITGGGSGIGLATAKRMASEGATVVIVDMNDEAGEAAAAAVSGKYVHADVTSPDDNERMYAETFDAYGSVDIAFHNAGISPPRRRLDPRHRPGRLASASRRSTSRRSTSAARR